MSRNVEDFKVEDFKVITTVYTDDFQRQRTLLFTELYYLLPRYSHLQKLEMYVTSCEWLVLRTKKQNCVGGTWRGKTIEVCLWCELNNGLVGLMAIEMKQWKLDAERRSQGRPWRRLIYCKRIFSTHTDRRASFNWLHCVYCNLVNFKDHPHFEFIGSFSNQSKNID